MPIYLDKANSKRYIHLHVYSSTLHNSQNMETTQMSINRWVDEDVMHIYNGILLSHENNEMTPFAEAHRTTWLKSETGHPTLSLPCGLYSAAQMNPSADRTGLTDAENRLAVAGGGEEGQGEGWPAAGVSRGQLSHLEGRNKVLV